MVKKRMGLISLFISVLLVFSSLCLNTFAEAETSAADTETVTETDENEVRDYGKYAEAVRTLFRFGILDETTFDVNASITRGDFIAKAMMITGSDAEFAPCDTEFTDVKSDNANSGAISAANKMGVVSGFGDGTFGSDKTLKKEQAAKILVTILGYEPYVTAYGGYPGGALTVASMQGVLKNLTIGDFAECTWGDAAQLIFNAMKTDVLQKKVYPENDFHTNDGENPMTLWMGIYKVNGTVISNETSSYNSVGAAKDGNVIIDGEQYIENGTGAYNYLGYPIKGYYKIDEDDNKVLMSFNIANSVREEILLADNIDDSTSVNSVVWFDENNTRRSMTISGASFIYNGKFMDSAPSDADIKPDSGYLRLVDTNGDKKAEIVYINNSEVMLVKSISASSGTITDKYLDASGRNKTLKLDPKDSELKYKIYKDGEEIGLDKIKENNVLSVTKSRDGKLVTVTVCSDKIKGIVNEIGDGKILIGEDTFEIVKSVEKEFSKLRPGDKSTFYFTADGQVAGYNSASNSSGLQYGYLIIGSIDMKGIGSGKSGNLRIFTFDNSVKEYKLGDKTTINGENVNGSGETYTPDKVLDELALSYDELNLYRHKNDSPIMQPEYKNGSSLKRVFCNQLIKFSATADNKIVEIETPLDNRVGYTNRLGEDGTGRHMDDFSYDFSYHSTTNGKYAAYKSFGFIEGSYHTTGSVAAKIPSSILWVKFYKGLIGLEKIEKSFSTFSTSASWGNDYRLYNCDIYDVSDTGACAIILEQDYSSIDSVDGSSGGTKLNPGNPPYDFMLVDKFTTSVDEDGAVVKKIYGCYQNKYQSWTFDEDRVTEEDLKSIEQGDVLRISVNGMGEIDGIFRIFALNPKKPGYVLYGDKFDDLAGPTNESIAADKITYKHDWNWNGNKFSWNVISTIMHGKYKAVEGGKTLVIEFGEAENGHRPQDRLLTYNDRSEVYVFDEAEKTVRLGTKEDIDPNNPKQTVVVRNRYYEAYESVIINRAEDPGTIFWYGPY